MARTNRLRGCYRRVLIFALIVVTVILAGGIFLYQRFGGFEGMRYWAAERALNKVEAHLLKKNPDGDWMRKPLDISENDIRAQFQKIHQAIANRQIDLVHLDRVLREYLTKFQRTKPSTRETIDFINNLEAATLPAESQ